MERERVECPIHRRKRDVVRGGEVASDEIGTAAKRGFTQFANGEAVIPAQYARRPRE